LQKTNNYSSVEKHGKYFGNYKMKFIVISIFIVFMIGQQPIESDVQSQKNSELGNAIKEYKQLVEKHSENLDLKYNLGNLQYLNGDLDKAIDYYKQSIGKGNSIDDANTFYNLGNSEFQKKNYENSIEYYKKALKLNPQDDDVKYNLELTQRILEQQPPQQQDQNSDDNDSDEENQENQKQNSESQNSENQENSDQKEEKQEHNQEETEEDSPEEKENQQDAEQKDEQQEQNENPAENENQEDEEKKGQHPKPNEEMTEQQKLKKEEAEAILNSMKANEDNLKPKQYKVKGRVYLEKDW